MPESTETSRLLDARLRATKAASRLVSSASAATRDQALAAIQEGLVAQSDAILAANAEDLRRGEAEGMSTALQDRLRLTPERIQGLVEAVGAIRALPDPVGDVLRGMTLPNGLQVSQVRVPFWGRGRHL